MRLALLALIALPCMVAQTDNDPAITLAHILAQKGQITSADVGAVEAAATRDRVTVLAGILQQKGILTGAEVASVSGPDHTPKLAGPSSASPAGSAPRSAMASSANAPSVPQQTLPQQRAEVDSGKRVPLTLSGTLLFNTGVDTTAMNLEDTPTIVTKPGSSATAGSKSFFATGRQTRVGLRLDPVPVGNALLTGNFEMDAFTNSAPFANGIDMNGFRLRLAYARLDWPNFAVEAGQDWTIFAPLNPTSFVMYAAAELQAAGNPWARIPQVRIEDKVDLSPGSRLLFQLAAEDPNVGDFPATFTGVLPPGTGELGRMPALESRAAWSFSDHGRDYMVGVSGRYGRGRNVATSGPALSQSVDSWGVALDYTLPFSPTFNLMGEAWEGRALGIYDVAAGESVGAPGTAGGHGVQSRGGWVQAQFNFTRKWQMNVGYGIDDPNARQIAAGLRDRNQNYFGNLIYSITPGLKLSPEYRRILSDYRGQAKGRGDQFSLNAAYLF